MLRLISAAVIALGSAGTILVAATPASAEPLCTSASATGKIGNYSAGPFCVPYPLATECNTTSGGLGTIVWVTESTCVPAL